MSLPFLKPKKQVGLVISTRKPSGEIRAEGNEGEEKNAALEACAEDMLRAINSKDSKALAGALRSAVICLDAEAMEDNEGYEAQNIKAAGQEE